MPDSEPMPDASEISGRSLQQAREMYEAAYNGRGFEISATEQPFHYRYTSAGSGGLTLRGNVFGGDVTGTTEAGDEYLVTWLTAGRGTLDLGRDEVHLTPGRPTMFPTGRPQRFHFRDYRQNIMHFDAAFLDEVAGEERGDHPDEFPTRLHFDHDALLTPTDLAAWNSSVAATSRILLGTSPSELIRAEVNRAAARAVLRTFPSETMAVIPTSRDGLRNGTLRQAVEFLHASAHLPISVSDAARSAGVTVRALQQGFSRHLGVTPLEYLRGIRLNRVRDELTASLPDTVSVAEVAARWGFAHAGRFAASYAARFGELPRETLRRTAPR
ncbi:AraC family transcriptional regulator [Frigoribacterium sp. 2-23]|uniref:AraC family transcriptional regulator n=1 Tax=Frigoribacterium sp. 2-23 TaxID=3415006 RepID=UPI003C6F6623